MSFIYNIKNFSIYLWGLVILLAMYLLFKTLPTKVAKKSDSKQSKTEDKVETKDKSNKEMQVEEINKSNLDAKQESAEKTQSSDKNSKKTDRTPKIIQVYKREQKQENGQKETKIDPIYNRNVEFVNVSKNVAKFKSFADESKKAEQSIEEEKDDFGFVEEIQDGCKFCEDKVKHFGHSRRLSEIIKEDSSEDMFASHLSEKYLNFNSERRLNIDEEFKKTLFSRAKNIIDEDDGFDLSGEKPSLFYSWDGFGENQNNEIRDDVKVDMKSALIADTYFNRKKKK